MLAAFSAEAADFAKSVEFTPSKANSNAKHAFDHAAKLRAAYDAMVDKTN